jgi:hypothetical protein
MITETGPAIWERLHQNGVRASVYHYPDRMKDEYSYGTASAAQMTSLTPMNGVLEAVQAAADKASGCPQPCKCRPWSEQPST